MNYETLQIRIEKIAQNPVFKVAHFCRANSIKKSKYCCHPPFHPPIFCRHSLKHLSPILPILMNWILLSPPPLSSDPDNPSKFETCTCGPADTDSLWPSLTRVKSGQAQFDASQNGQRSSWAGTTIN